MGFLSGAPIHRSWVVYVGCGSTGVGLLSIPSYGPPIGLIPMFLLAAVLMAVGAAGRNRRSATSGLAVAAVAAWARAVALWGVGQHGAGSDVLATFVWIWIAVGAVLLAAAIGRRGIE